jgi:hypothetical protein
MRWHAVPALALSAVLATTCGRADAGTPAATTPPPASPGPPVPQVEPVLLPSPAGPLVPSRSGRSKLLLIGDSLTARIVGLLPRRLPGWRIGINGVGGRPLAEGMAILAQTKLPADGSIVLALGLFSNDDPRRVAQLEVAVRTSLERVGPRGCVIWATIWRPPFLGVTYERANRTLRGMAARDRRMRLVRWAERLRGRPELLDASGIHPRVGSGGWTLRARMFAAAALRC